MRSRAILISASLVLLVALALSSGGDVSVAAPSAAPTASAQPDIASPALVTDPDAAPAGIYVFYDYQHLDPRTYPIQGGHISIPWSRVAVGEGSYNWAPVEDWLAREIALGKRVGLGFNPYDGQCCGGSGVPTHVKARYPNSVVYCSGVEIPRYWDAGFKTALREFVLTLGQRYGNHPNVAWIEAAVGIYGETAPAEDTYTPCLKSAGLTSAMWIDYVNWVTDLYREAFPNKQLFLQFAPTFDQRNERIAFTDHAASAGVGLKHNGLKPDGGGDAIIDDPLNLHFGGGQYDPVLKWGDQVATAWEAYENQEGSLRGRTATMWGIYNALDKHADYLVFATELVTAADRQDLFAFANRYLGQTLAQTPSVWVAMRETEYTWFPDYGNFEFWLTQRDSAPGGRTLPLFNVNAAPEGRYGRSTDQATGNASMFFDVDNRYAYDTHRKATFTITYYDKGTDRWELRYDAADNADKVAQTVWKTNSLTWKTVTVTVPDARFGDRQPGGTDFRIWSAGDGDEIIHFVDVESPGGVTVETTLQAERDGYRGVTDTTLDLWAPSTNFGSAALMRLRYNAGTAVTTHMAPLLRFDLTSIPRDANLLEATLNVYLAEGERTDRELVGAVHGLLRGWDEPSATWQRASLTNLWAQGGAQAVGADRMGEAADRQTLTMPAKWIAFDVSALAAEWIANPAANFGALMLAEAGSIPTNFELRLASREYGNPDYRPSLTLKYIVPADSVPRRTSTPTRTPTTGISATPTRTPTASQTPTPSRTPTTGPTPTPTATPPTLVSRSAVVAPAIDGDLSEWQQQEHVLLSAASAQYLRGQANPAPSDLSAEVRSMWNADWLYFAALVLDEVIIRDSPNIWDDDGIEFALDGKNDSISQQTDDHQFTVASDGTLVRYGAYPVPGAQVAVGRFAGGYTVELALPASGLAAGALSEGKLMGFTIGLIDDDDGVSRSGPEDNYLIWVGYSTVGEAYNYGKLRLGPAYTPPTPDPNRTPTSTATATRTRTATPSATVTATPSRTPTTGVTATPTPTATASATSTSSPTATGVLTPTGTPSSTPTPTRTPEFGSVGGLAFHDTDGDMVPGPGDAGLEGAVIALKLGGQERYLAVSDGTGVYQFSQVTPGQYLLEVKSPPPGYYPSLMSVVLQVQAGQTLAGMNLPHRAAQAHTPTPTATGSPTLTATLIPTSTPTATATATATFTVTPTATSSPPAATLPTYLPLVYIGAS